MSSVTFTPLAFGFMLGMIVAALIAAAVVLFALKTPHPKVRQAVQRFGPKMVPALIAVMVGVLLFAVGGVKADTPVPLTIPTNDIFTAANNWIQTFSPIASIGIGISIALAVLGYLGTMIVKAFRA